MWVSSSRLVGIFLCSANNKDDLGMDSRYTCSSGSLFSLLLVIRPKFLLGSLYFPFSSFPLNAYKGKRIDWDWMFCWFCDSGLGNSILQYFNPLLKIHGALKGRKFEKNSITCRIWTSPLKKKGGRQAGILVFCNPWCKPLYLQILFPSQSVCV